MKAPTTASGLKTRPPNLNHPPKKSLKSSTRSRSPPIQARKARTLRPRQRLW
jgi:hypothetical protein